jgi:hypothetical protein
MEDTVVIEREGQHNVMKLDADEEAMLNEISISNDKPVKKAVYKPKAKPRRVTQQQYQEPEMDAFMNPTKSVETQPRPQAPPDEYGDEEEPMMFGDDDGDYEGGGGGGGGYEGEQPSPGFTTIDDEKADLLNKITRLEKKGFPVNKRLNAYSSIQELRTEYKRITYSIEVDQSIRFSRRMLVACVTGLEFLNKRYNPFEIALEGWSESVMENMDDYDGVFEELYNKYKTKMNVAPEVKLIMMLGGSAMMFHLTNSMFKAAIPNMNDVVKQNPDLVRSMMDAVQNTVRQPSGPPPEPVVNPETGRREMNGPGFDISSLMGGITMPPPPPMNTTPLQSVQEIDEDDDLSDIVSISGDSTGGEVKEVNVKGGKGRGRGRKKKNEVTI